MEEVSQCENLRKGKYYTVYLPHHAVIKPDKKTTEVRVVFNVSKFTTLKIP